jgi:hypothetical protein
MTNATTTSIARNWILLGIPVLFLVGCIMHFIYEWSGNSVIVGIFAPVSESIWEHLKLTFWPMLLWWIAGYIILSKNNTLSASQWLFSTVIAELVCILTIVSFYYTYTGALGIESLFLDIFSLFLAIILAQCLAYHFYCYAKVGVPWLFISLSILILMAIVFTLFTFSPPNLPIFISNLSFLQGKGT